MGSITYDKGVFKGGVQGVQTPPPKFLDFFLKSEGKEIERKKRDVGGGGGVEKFSRGGGVEKFSGGGVRNFRGS